jgi:hypothetical protein
MLRAISGPNAAESFADHEEPAKLVDELFQRTEGAHRGCASAT